MTYTTGTYTSANPGPALYTAIETAALALGWTLEDTVTIGGNTHKLLKSAAAGNTYNLDYFIDINYPTTGVTGGFRMAPFEYFDPATDLGTRGPYSANTSVIETTNYSRYGATGSALETNWANSASYSGLSLVLSTAATTYWVSVTRDRIIVILSSDPTFVLYSGFWEASAAYTTYAGASLFPLITVKLQGHTRTDSNTSAASVRAAITRIPKVTVFGGAENPANWGSTVSTNPALAWNRGGLIGGSATTILGTPQASTIPVFLGIGSGSSYDIVPASTYVGVLRDVSAAYSISTAVRGDTVTIGADTWVLCSPSLTYNTILMKAV
jgi:hypothetical protein